MYGLTQVMSSAPISGPTGGWSGSAGVLADGRDGVDAEALDATVEPEAQDVGEHRLDVGVRLVEVGLVRA